VALSSALLLKPGLAQTFPEVIYPRLIRVHTFQGHPRRDEVRIEFLQVRKCGARFVDLPELVEGAQKSWRRIDGKTNSRCEVR
jgi:hypothetical protein